MTPPTSSSGRSSPRASRAHFQRVTSAKDADTARNGAVIGGLSYIAFAFVPMFVVLSAVVVMGPQALELA